jgi:hypothetical protein
MLKIFPSRELRCLGAVPALAAVTVRLTTDGNGDIELARDLRVTL